MIVKVDNSFSVVLFFKFKLERRGKICSYKSWRMSLSSSLCREEWSKNRLYEKMLERVFIGLSLVIIMIYHCSPVVKESVCNTFKYYVSYVFNVLVWYEVRVLLPGNFLFFIFVYLSRTEKLREEAACWWAISSYFRLLLFMNEDL